MWRRAEHFVVRDYVPEATCLSRIELAARGWDYEGYIDNVRIRNVEEAPCSVEEISWSHIKNMFR